MALGLRVALFQRPVWQRPERYYTDETGGLTPFICDGRLNILAGLDISGGPIPALSGLPDFGLSATYMGYVLSGQSNVTAYLAQNGDSVAGVGYDHIMDTNGLKVGAAGNAYVVSLIRALTSTTLAESNTSGFAAVTDEGETHTTVALKTMTDLAFANGYIASKADNKWIANCAGKISTRLSSRVPGSSTHLFDYISDAVKGQNTIVGAGYTFRYFCEFGQESDALLAETQSNYYSLLANQLTMALYNLGRNTTAQSAPVFCLVWQSSYGLIGASGNAGPALAAYDFATNHPLGCGIGPNWMHERNTSDFLHFVKAGQQKIGEYVGRALYQLLFEKRKPDIIKLRSTRYEDGYIKILFDVPTAPLVIDATTFGSATQNGIRAFDTISDLTLSSMAAHGSEIWAIPNRAPVGSFTVNVGLDYAISGGTFPRIVQGGAGANICDSTNPNPHWVPHAWVAST